MTTLFKFWEWIMVSKYMDLNNLTHYLDYNILKLSPKNYFTIRDRWILAGGPVAINYLSEHRR